MAWDPCFLDLMRQQVLWEPFISEDEDGNPTWGAGQRISANVETYSRVRGRTDNNDEGPLNKEAMCSLIVEVRSYSERDRITLPAGVTMGVYEVATTYDEDGPHHCVLQAREGETV